MASRIRTRAAVATVDDVETAVEGDETPARERILVAANQLFSEQGYDGTPVSRIAAQAGMTTPNLYWHFSSKEELLFALLERMYVDWYEGVRAVIPDGTADVRLAAFVREYVRTQLRTSEGRSYSYATLLASLGKEWRSELRRIERQINGLLREILQQGVDEGAFHVRDVKIAAFAISNACEYVFSWYKPSGELTEDAVCDTYVEMMLSLVGATPSR